MIDKKNMINEEFYEDYKKAGNIHKKVMSDIKQKIKVGMGILEIVKFAEKKIESYDGKCAFPVNISINEQAAHNTPIDTDIDVFRKNDIVKIDIGIHINGFIADGAETIEFSNNHSNLIKASDQALKAAIDIVKSGTKIKDIGSIIETTILDYGYNPIRNLMGHGLKQYTAHFDPSIPNYNNNDNTKLIDGQIIAIEPFATTGSGYVIDGKIKNIYSQIKLKNTRVSFVRKVLNQIESYYGLPFSSRWIESQKTSLALNQLEKEGIIIGYPVLIESTNGMVSQKEHTIIVHDWGAEILT